MTQDDFNAIKNRQARARRSVYETKILAGTIVEDNGDLIAEVERLTKENEMLVCLFNGIDTQLRRAEGLFSGR